MPQDPDDLSWFQQWAREFDAGVPILTESPPCEEFARSIRSRGFDPGSPDGDKTAYATVRFNKLDRYEFTVEDLEYVDLDPRVEREFAEQLRRHRERVEDLWRSTYQRAWNHDRFRYEPAGDARPRDHYRAVGDHEVDELTQRCRNCGIDLHVMADGRSVRCGVEVIVDQADSRGIDAKPARVRP